MDDVQELSVLMPDDEATHNTDAPSDDDCKADDVLGYVWEDTYALPAIPETTVKLWLYSDDQKWTVALLKLLDDMACPKSGKGRTGARPDRRSARAKSDTAGQAHPDKETHRRQTRKGRTRYELLTIRTNSNRRIQSS